MFQRIMECRPAIDHELIHANVPPIMHTVIGIVGHHLHMRIDQIAVLGSEERSQVVGIDDDIRFDPFQYTEIFLAGAAVESRDHEWQGVMDTANMRHPHLDIVVPRKRVSPFDVPHKTLLNLTQLRVFFEGIFADNFNIGIMQCLNSIGDRIGGSDMPESSLDIGH